MQSVCQTLKNFLYLFYSIICILIMIHDMQNATIIAKCNAKCYTVSFLDDIRAYFRVYPTIEGVFSFCTLIEIVSQQRRGVQKK